MFFRPEFFDIFGIGVFGFLFVASFWTLKTGEPFPKWAVILFLIIGIVGLIVDGGIVYTTYIRWEFLALVFLIWRLPKIFLLLKYMAEVMLEKTKEYLIVKIPLKSVKSGRAEISHKSRRIVDAAISEGLRDLKSGRVFGPFENVREFKTALKIK